MKKETKSILKRIALVLAVILIWLIIAIIIYNHGVFPFVLEALAASAFILVMCFICMALYYEIFIDLLKWIKTGK